MQTLRIDRIGGQGDGIAETPTGPVFAPLTLPGETVRAQVVEGRAEAVEIVFDPSKTTYRDILAFFFQIHDPTTKDRQGNDRGLSYRSGIYYVDDEQKRVAEETIADVDASGLWDGKVVTEVEPVGDFWEAEPEHQDYLEKRPGGYTCHFPRANWVLPKRDDAGATQPTTGAAAE